MADRAGWQLDLTGPAAHAADGVTPGALLVDPQPTVPGRWQPTRAGVVGSWQWASEQLLFRAGWLALTGENGSGKSLTAAMLCPTLLDGNVRPTALSVSARAGGTLADRHTNWRPGPPRTGVWWLEFGRADPDPATGAAVTRWLTVGLWLRSRGGDKAGLERAWFVVAARVGEALVVERDGDAIDVEGLAEQLARLEGRLFTSHERLSHAAHQQLPVVADEDGFADAVRTALYQPLDADQFDALTTVLRALRSVRVNDTMSPDEMHAQLTSALPALDAARVQRLANALTKMEQIEGQLKRHRGERDSLAQIVSVYRRYAGAVAARAAVRLLRANTEFDTVTRQENALARDEQQHNGIFEAAEQAAAGLEARLEKLETTIQAILAQSREHPGAGLEPQAQRVAELEAAAAEAGQVADGAEEAAEREHEDAAEREREAAGAVAHVRAVLGRLERRAEELDAVMLHRQATAVSTALISTPGAHAAGGAAAPASGEAAGAAGFDDQVDEVEALVHAWADERLAAIRKVIAQLAAHDAACRARDATEERLAKARSAVEEAAESAEEAAEEAGHVEAALVERLNVFRAGLRQLSAPPIGLLETRPVDVEAVERWADQALAGRLADLDVPGAESRAAVAAQAAVDAASDAAGAQQTATAAASAAAQATAELGSRAGALAAAPPALAALAIAARAAADSAHAPTSVGAIGPLDADTSAALAKRHTDQLEAAAQAARDEVAGRFQRLQHARDLLRTAEQAQAHATQDAEHDAAAEREAAAAEREAAAAVKAATAAVATWVGQLEAWAAGLEVLDLDQLPLGVTADTALQRADLGDSSLPDWLYALAAAVADAHRAAAVRLAAVQTGAEREAADLAGELETVAEEIGTAEHAAPAPAAPPWRPKRAGRPVGSGAPLWALVDFTRGLPAEQAGRLEGALLAAGLLDAWVSADGRLSAPGGMAEHHGSTAGEVQLLPGAAQPGRTLADLLVPDPASPIPVDRVRTLLRSIRVTDTAVGDTSSPGVEQVVFHVAGAVRSGLLHATSPAGWYPRHIGPTAREHARQRALTELRARQAALAATHTAAVERARKARNDLVRAAQEAEEFPGFAELFGARQAAADAHDDARRARQAAATAAAAAAGSAAAAAKAAETARAACMAAHCTPDEDAVTAAMGVCAALPELIAQAAAAGRHAATSVLAARATAARAATLERDRATAAVAAERSRRDAVAARAEHARLPDLEPVRDARQRADTAEDAAALAAAAADETDAEQRRCVAEVTAAIKALNQATRPVGRPMLPTTNAALEEQEQKIRALLDDTAAWGKAAVRAQLLAVAAARQHQAGRSARASAARLRSRAHTAAVVAQRARYRYEQELRVHGRAYEELLAELTERRREQEAVKAQHDAEVRRGRDAELELVRITERRAGLDKSREDATRVRDTALVGLQRLFDHHLVADVTGAQALARPAGITPALDVARQLVEQRSLHGGDRVQLAEEAVDRALRELDTRVRRVRADLTRTGRDIALDDDPQGDWKQVMVTEPGSAAPDPGLAVPSSRPLRVALRELERSIQGLEADFNEQVRTEVKGALFTDLRRHINERITLAEQVVDDIRATLKGVRTGVARVGVRLTWKPRDDDPAAREAIALIREPNLEGEFDRMYEFFVPRLQAATEEPTWARRVQRVFDYRAWYAWKVEITHAEFHATGDEATGGDDANQGEVFRTVAVRRNPLESLSTGEKRLATLLPLLAAARAFYTVQGFEGPHLLFIDELDAAFDTPNLRRTLELLHAWEFDVLATLPSMEPLLVAETGSVAIHKVRRRRQDGARYTVPSVWDGSGLPRAARITMDGQPTAGHSGNDGTSGTPPDRTGPTAEGS
jgi:hypothetical protein